MTTGTAPPPALRPGTSERRGSPAVAIGNEVVKGLLHGWSERWQIVFETAMFAAMLLLFAALLGQGDAIIAGRFDWQLDPGRTAWLLVGFGAFTFHYLQTQKLFWRLLGEIQADTLEQVYLSPLPSWIVAAAGRIVANVVETTFVVAALYAAVRITVPLPLTWSADALIPLTGLVTAAVGYSLVVGGLTLRWKRIEILNDGLHIVVLFLGGGMVALDRLPHWMAAIGRLLPITHPIEGLRTTLVDDAPLTAYGDGGLVWLTLTAAGWLLLGAVAFHRGDRSARRNGSLTRY
jgi:ABC-2 type transport system permease protein